MKTSNKILLTVGLLYLLFTAIHIGLKVRKCSAAQPYAEQLLLSLSKTPIRTVIAVGRADSQFVGTETTETDGLKRQSIHLFTPPTPEVIRIEGDTLFINTPDLPIEMTMPYAQSYSINGIVCYIKE
ncbi:MAG: hypothetical protein RR330_03675 [Alistipes sp.]